LHALALSALIFGLGLGAYSEPSFIPLYLMILIIFAGLIHRTDRRYLVILIVSPLLAYGSFSLYYGAGSPVQVRIDDVQSYRVTASHLGRRFLMEGLQEEVRPGEIIEGRFEFERMEANKDGFKGKLTVRDYKRSADFLSGIKEFKERLFHKLVYIYGYDKGSLIGSLVLGYRTELFQDRMGSMRALGILHILSISGFHIALLEDALKRLKLGRGAVWVILLYGVLVDSVSSYRAVLMCLYRAAGHAFRRDPDPVTGLATAFFLQSLMKPYLVFSFGFLLTYLSTLGIILLGKKVKRRFSDFPEILGGPIAMTISALTFSMPFLIILEGGLSLGVFLGNLVMVPLYTIITYLSFIVVILMGVEPLTVLLRPLVGAFFDLSLHLGEAISIMTLKLHLLPLLAVYPALLGICYHSIRKKRLKTLSVILLLCLLYVLPLFDSLEVINRNGKGLVRVTSGFRVYEIMDDRLNEKDYLPLDSPMEFLIGGNQVGISQGYSKGHSPVITINGKRLKVKSKLGYYNGMSIEMRIIFLKGKVLRVR
jgi:competence protein ComEC